MEELWLLMLARELTAEAGEVTQGVMGKLEGDGVNS